MAPPSRAIYIKFEQEARGSRTHATQNNAKAAWNDKTPRQKDRILDLIEATKDTEAVVHPNATVLAESAQLNTEAILVRAGQGFDDWLEAHEDALAANTEVVKAYSRVQAAWNRLDRELQLQGNDPILRAYAQGRQQHFMALHQAAAVVRDQTRTHRDQPPIPADVLVPGAPMRMPAEWVSQDRFDNTVRVRNAAGSNYAVALGTWRCRTELTGGSGRSSVWILEDAAGNIADRHVSKEADLSKDWHDMRAWRPRRFPLGLQGPTTFGALQCIFFEDLRVPMEYDCHEELCFHSNGAPNIVRLLQLWRPAFMDATLKTFRMDTAWCPHGSLANLIDRYVATGDHIPEPFIWAVAEALGNAAHGMQFGTFRGNGQAPSWECIVHRNLKPSNVFLDVAPGPGNPWPDYPTVRLGDFGLAFMAYPNFVNGFPVLDKFLRKRGEEGFEAPEMRRYVDRNTLDEVSMGNLNELTNVFGIGVVLFCLVTLTNSPPRANWLGDRTEDTTYTLTGSNHNNVGFYSEALLSLIDDCTNPMQILRYNPIGLLTKVLRNTTTDVAQMVDHSDGMRAGNAGQDQLIPNRLDLGQHYRIDPYLIGSAVNQIPPPW